MSDDLRTRIAAVLMDSLCAEIDKLGQYRHRYTPTDDNGEPMSEWWLGIDGSVDVMAVADAVIRELTETIPPIVATAIKGYVQAELAAISHHGEAGEYEALKRLNREALQIAQYATTHKDWNG